MNFRHAMLRHVMAVVASLLLMSAPAQSAVLQNISGQVVINKGDGFEAATENVEVLPGDQVVIAPGATATLAYGGGCNVPVPSETVAVVAAAAPCPAAQPSNSQGWQVLTQAAQVPAVPGAAAGGAPGAAGGAAAGGGAAGGAAGGGAAAGGLGGLGALGTAGVVVGVGAAVGVTAAIIANQNSKSASQ